MAHSSTTIDPPSRREIPALTGLRFLAALFVLLAHSASFIKFAGPEPAWVHYLAALSGVGMPLFFVLSGFVIHYNYSASIRSTPARGAFNFFIARFARLYPMFFVVLCLDLFRFGYFESLANPGIAQPFYAAIPSYLLLVQSWHYQITGQHSLVFTFPAMTTVTWSVSTEWFFYLIYPIVCLALAKLRGPRAVLLATAGVILAGYASIFVAYENWAAIDAFATRRFGQVANSASTDSFEFWLFYLSPYPRLFEFGLGCLAAALFLALQDVAISRREALVGRGAMAFALVGGIAVFVLLFDPAASAIPLTPVLRMYFGFAPFVALLLFCCARYRGWVSLALSRRWMIVCGEASYSIYLLHIGIVQYVEVFNLNAKVPAAVYDVWGVLHALVSLASVTMVVVGLSLITHRLIEMPARRLLRRLQLRSSPARSPEGARGAPLAEGIP